jgi:hypothetical protein
MAITDEELSSLHDQADGPVKELLAELMRARKALPLAKKLSQLAPLLDTSLFTMQLQESAPPEEIFLGILHKNPAGGGRVGPSWPLGEFHQDLKTLGDLLLTEDEQLDLKAAMLSSMFVGERTN